jgi:hypothetical protein
MRLPGKLVPVTQKLLGGSDILASEHYGVVGEVRKAIQVYFLIVASW